VESIYFLDYLSFLFSKEIKEYAWLGIVKFDWDCTLVEFTVANLKVLAFNWDCTLVISEHLEINGDFTLINLQIYNNNLLSFNLYITDDEFILKMQWNQSIFLIN